MDKKKVIKLIKQAVSELSATDMGIICTQSTLESALEELQKSDWISVENELPPRDTYVWVRSIANPNVVWTARRATLKEFDTESLDSNDFITFGHSSITHWHKIDEL